ncbi:D-lactate dehydrogenase [Staphylococcus lugdunensis]|uniref:D-lactate dehydrogenase n=1 Tax=Staphylococcus lugdunensis TaxID=28035 RepID=UPI0002991D4C|nr:D-lactate dehydrogenase [Staphylococcus lugdunensis]ARJ08365.1 lactate dehydrogenase [Staphylococcus lugdunensis]EKS23439.1 D-lactate dehydrogenase [Staphylococcus lugdunensis ACS-027-V-Sch2]MCI2760749.1 D-lactate dehydrogenase [Staphylococcus lugdunensis]MCI2764696.1 D-lactate dehydrogenase [Staphylococcus lugdunensis]MCI2794802.1 D-lactate dehydrogenase [Staphylococcus lugdunensis]
MTKIMFFGTRDYEKKDALNWGKAHNVEVVTSEEILSADTVDQLEGFDGVTTMQFGKLEDSVYPKLEGYGIKQIAQRTAGFDMYDLDLAKKHGIVISNVPSYSPETIAEYSVSIALQLVRKFPLIEKRVQAQNFKWAAPIMSTPVKNMTVAIIGTGRIGAATGKIYAGFGAKVVGFDAYPNHSLDFLEYKDSVEEAIKDADIISLHVPANKESFHLFDKSMFSKVKKGAILVNAARGAVIDTPALLDAVNDGTLSGAAIDTYENEADYFTYDWTGKDVDDPTLLELIRHENILVTPHIAFFSDEAVRNLVEGGLNAALSVIETGKCDTQLN